MPRCYGHRHPSHFINQMKIGDEIKVDESIFAIVDFPDGNSVKIEHVEGPYHHHVSKYVGDRCDAEFIWRLWEANRRAERIRKRRR